MMTFGLVLTGIVLLMALYVTRRVMAVIPPQRPWLRRAFAAAVIGASALFIMSRLLGRGHGSGWPVAFGQAGYFTMILLFHCACCLLVVDFVTGFGFWCKRLVPRLRLAALLAACALSLIALGQGHRAPVVESYEVAVPGLPAELDGKVVVALSDLHFGETLGEEWLAGVIGQVTELQPDMVVLLGDIFEGHGNPSPDELADFRRLRPPLGMWAVIGNHDSRHDELYNSLAGDTTLRVLTNEWHELRPGFVLVGIEEDNAHRGIGNTPELLAKELRERPPGATMLLIHSPRLVEHAADAGVELMLCGHTHGGQVWPFSYAAQGIYRYLAGRYAVKNTTVIVSRGAGTWGPRMRLWQRGEISRIVLRAPATASTRLAD